MVNFHLKNHKQGFSEPSFRAVRENREGWPWWKRLRDWRKNQRRFVLIRDWVIWVDYLQCWVLMPKGFEFDGVSVPKIFSFFIGATDVLFFAAILHDFIYRFNTLIVRYDNKQEWELLHDVGRIKADMLLYHYTEQVENMHFPNAVVTVIMLAFGIFKWRSWRKRKFKLVTTKPRARYLGFKAK